MSFVGRLTLPFRLHGPARWSVTDRCTTANAARGWNLWNDQCLLWKRFISLRSRPCLAPLDEFRDPISRQKRASERVGRSWSVRELRIKSYSDLHKLWFVLYKERNMLLTEQQLSRRKTIMFPQPERIQKVRKSMGAIKQVLGERKRVKLSQLAARKGGNEIHDDEPDIDDEREAKK